VLPDITTCNQCLADVFDPANRRYRYPFTNCTNCGPRFTIIEALPYDRPQTTMKGFEMCAPCRAEYENPLDRRFHAQPNACPACGPHLELWNEDGKMISAHHTALLDAADAIRRGAIVAVKGLGGFHLVADARNNAALHLLRGRKRRDEKPLALMYPTLEMIKAHCQVSPLERRLLLSPESPIVLLKRKQVPLQVHGPQAPVANSRFHLSPLIAPGNPYLGVMLPYTPLHRLLMAELRFPIVATSGNLSDEPICTDEHEAITRLRGIAEFFLVHNRPIARHVDDSIVRVMSGREMVMRRARGYAPLPVTVEGARGATIAVGAHLKNTIAASIDSQAFLSQHIGDLETAQAFDAFQQVIASFERLYGMQPTTVACDAHPEYLSTKFARASGLPVVAVQHHYAHVLACMAENRLRGTVLGIAWDGTGYGLDGTIWGGEFLRVTTHSCQRDCACANQDDGTPFQRVAHLRTFRLPGGGKAVREPRRTAVGLLYEIFGESLFDHDELAPVQAFTGHEREMLKMMFRKQLNTPVTSSAGRLFDAVAALVGLRQIGRFEGQPAMELEFAADSVQTDANYPFEISHCRFASETPTRTTEPAASDNQPAAIIVDWEPMIRAIIDDVSAQISVAGMAAKFHNTLVEMIVALARRIGDERVVLTGGCFQNKYLTERAVRRLEREGFRPYWHQRVPPNDGGIALGQVVAAARSSNDGA